MFTPDQTPASDDPMAPVASYFAAPVQPMATGAVPPDSTDRGATAADSTWAHLVSTELAPVSAASVPASTGAPPRGDAELPRGVAVFPSPDDPTAVEPNGPDVRLRFGSGYGFRHPAVAIGVIAASLLLVMAIVVAIVDRRAQTSSVATADPAAPDDVPGDDQKPLSQDEAPGAPSQPAPNPGTAVEPPAPKPPDAPAVELPGTAVGPQSPATTAAPNVPPQPAPPAQVPAAAPTDKPPPTPTAQSDPARPAELRQTFRAVRAAWNARDTAKATQSLEQAAKLATSADEKQELQRLQTLDNHVKHFWGAVSKSLSDLRVGEELHVGSTIVAVVEASPGSLTVHVTGTNQTFTLATLPAGLALLLAERSLDAQSPDTKVSLGAFHAVDGRGQPKVARRLWEEASLAGADVDELLPLLGKAGDEAEQDRPLSPPSAAELATAQKRIETSLRREIAAAKSPAKAAQLTKKLLASAETSDEPADRYALLARAADLASRSGNTAQMLDIVNQMAKSFQVDALQMKVGYLLTEKTGENKLAAKRLARSALPLLDQALERGRPALAKKLLEITLKAARTSGDSVLLKQAEHRQERLKQLPPAAG